MSITRVGANRKYALGWDLAFGSKKQRTDAKSAGARAAKPARACGKKMTGKQAATKKVTKKSTRKATKKSR